MLETGLVRCMERERENGQSGASLLHACVTDFAGSPESVSKLKEIAIDRLSIAGVSSCCCCCLLSVCHAPERNTAFVGKRLRFFCCFLRTQRAATLYRNVSLSPLPPSPLPPPRPPFPRRLCLQMVLSRVDPAVDAGAVDSAGLTVLHRVGQALDLPYLALLLEERSKSQGWWFGSAWFIGGVQVRLVLCIQFVPESGTGILCLRYCCKMVLICSFCIPGILHTYCIYLLSKHSVLVQLGERQNCVPGVCWE